MIRTVIFDIDNTVYSFTKANELARAALKAYTHAQFGWSEEEYEKAESTKKEEIFSLIGPVSGFRARIVRYQNMLEEKGLPLYPHARTMTDLYWKTLIDEMQIEEGALTVFQTLKERGLRLGIGTDMTAYMQFVKLEKLGLLPYVDFMVTSEEAGAEKPDPRFFARCAEKIGCPRSECLFVGDDINKDYFGARGAGFAALWYNPNHKTCSTKAEEIHSLMDLLVFCQNGSI